MQKGTQLRNHLDQLNKIILEFNNIDVEVDDENATLIMLVSLPLSYKNFVQYFIVGKYTISVRSGLLFTLKSCATRRLGQVQIIRVLG